MWRATGAVTGLSSWRPMNRQPTLMARAFSIANLRTTRSGVQALLLGHDHSDCFLHRLEVATVKPFTHFCAASGGFLGQLKPTANSRVPTPQGLFLEGKLQ